MTIPRFPPDYFDDNDDAEPTDEQLDAWNNRAVTAPPTTTDLIIDDYRLEHGR